MRGASELFGADGRDAVSTDEYGGSARSGARSVHNRCPCDGNVLGIPSDENDKP